MEEYCRGMEGKQRAGMKRKVEGKKGETLEGGWVKWRRGMRSVGNKMVEHIRGRWLGEKEGRKMGGG